MKEFKSALQNYAVFSGRATRRDYWMFMLFYFLIGLGLGFVDVVTGLYSWELDAGPLSGGYSLVMLIPCLAISVRRMHDSGHSGWWVLLAFIPLLGTLPCFIFMLLGSDRDNEYGPRPAMTLDASRGPRVAG
jgi:uncharacterized membrane protein YhaH (DUF805 family)